MTVDIERLEVLAKAASQGSWNQDGFDVQNDDTEDYRVSRCNLLADAKFIAAANPAAVLAMIASGKQQAQQFKEWQASHHANYCNVADERDQLRAENAGLRTGYEAYERVNAELKAEVELLRSLLGQSALAATTLRTDAEAYANHSGFNRVFVDLIRSISGVEVGHGYGSSKYPQQADVVAALGQGEQS